MSALSDKVRELWNSAPSDRRLDEIVDVFTAEMESLRAELEEVKSRRLARCSGCDGATTRKYADDSWGPCEDCDGAGLIIVDKETT